MGGGELMDPTQHYPPHFLEASIISIYFLELIIYIDLAKAKSKALQGCFKKCLSQVKKLVSG